MQGAGLRLLCLRSLGSAELVSHRYKASHSWLCQSYSHTALQSPLLPNWDWYHVLPLPPLQFPSKLSAIFNEIFHYFLLFTKTAELSRTMLKAPIAFIMGFPFHQSQQAGKEPGMDTAFLKNKNLLLQMSPHPIPTRQALRLSTDKGGPGRLCYCPPSCSSKEMCCTP